MEKYWKIKPLQDAATVEKLTNTISNLHPLVSRLLVQKGLHEVEEIRKFFNPKVEDLHDPFLMKDMDKAVERIHRAVENGEKILVYGDYDVDGTTAVAVVYSFISRYSSNVDFYIPDRYREGYGISEAGIQFAADHGFSLVIALDCGIKAIARAEQAKMLNVDLVIGDHHQPGDVIPDAFAVLDPKQKDCNYPYKELCGCGVGFKILQGLCKRYHYNFGLAMDLIDLVAVAIASDIVPLTGENRILAFHGLKKINHTPRPGLKALIQTASAHGKLSIEDVVFKIGPRINAAGRIKSGKEAVQLLIADKVEDAESTSLEIESYNKERKSIDKNITQEALAMIAADNNFKELCTSVLYADHWHKGVIGIVASRLIETHYRPTIVLTHTDGKYTGSARSIKGVDVYAAIDACSELVEQFGGHTHAAGLTIAKNNIESFCKRFNEVVENMITEEMMIPVIEVDMEIDLDEIYLPAEVKRLENREKFLPEFYKQMNRLAPFGPENMCPVFVTHNCIDSGWSKIVGGDHLKLHFIQGKNKKIAMEGIAFKCASFCDKIKKGEPFSIVYTLDKNEFNGKTSLQANVKDIRFQA